MKEVDLQAKAKDAVLEMGGFAMKMSNRFLIGVPDLMFQLPGHGTSFWEVKWAPRPAVVALLTIPQKKWLRNYHNAGGHGGVIYFVHDASDMKVAMKDTNYFSYEDLRAPWKFKLDDFVTIPRGSKMLPFKNLVEHVHEEWRDCQM